SSFLRLEGRYNKVSLSAGRRRRSNDLFPQNLMRERLARPISFGHQNLPYVECGNVFSDYAAIYITDGAFAATNQMQRDFPGTRLRSPIIEVCCDSKGSITGDKLKN